jgi:hypothetical protein
LIFPLLTSVPNSSDTSEISLLCHELIYPSPFS